MNPRLAISASILLTLPLSGCSKSQVSTDQLMFMLGADNDAHPSLHIAGHDSYAFNTAITTFKVQLGVTPGPPWMELNGTMTNVASNKVVISIESVSDRPYKFQLIGMAPTDGEISEEKAQEILSVTNGRQKFSLTRYIIFTYENNRSLK